MKKITPLHLLYGFVSLMLILGLFISSDYGFTTDEDSERIRAKIALSHYGIPNDNQQKTYEQIRHKKYYGTVISMVGVLADELLSPILNTPINAVWHGFNYLLFIVSVVSIYYLVRLFASESIALFASLLYASQPLYFGHGFMNPKDMPLQAMFILTITFGFYTERHHTWRRQIDLPYSMEIQLRYWYSVFACWGVLQRWVNAFALIVLIALMFFKQWVSEFVAGIIQYIYTYPASLPGRVFWALVSKLEAAHSAEYITHKLYMYYERAYPLQIIGVGLYLGCVYFFTYRRHPTLRKNSPVLRYSDNIILLAAGIVFGIALSTRIIAIAAGGIVWLYYLWSYHKKAIPPLILYSVTAFLVHYITWPVYLEYNLFPFLKDCFSFLIYFSPQRGVVVPFEGKLYSANALPNHYLAKLLTIQFTLPLVLLAFLGVTVWLVFHIRKRSITPTFRKELLILMWFLLPFAYITINVPIMYNSFRQFLFITPPLIVFASIGAEHIKPYLPKALIICLMGLSLIPGVMAIINLHPYQYIYYNRYAGGVQAAFENYELDYWFLATSEAMAFVNATAEPNAKIYITWEAGSHARIYKRPDLKIPKGNQFANFDDVDDSYQYAVVSTQYFQHRQVPSHWRVLHTVEVQGTPLFFIYALK